MHTSRNEEMHTWKNDKMKNWKITKIKELGNTNGRNEEMNKWQNEDLNKSRNEEMKTKEKNKQRRWRRRTKKKQTNRVLRDPWKKGEEIQAEEQTFGYIGVWFLLRCSDCGCSCGVWSVFNSCLLIRFILAERVFLSIPTTDKNAAFDLLQKKPNYRITQCVWPNGFSCCCIFHCRILLNIGTELPKCHSRI